jgi:hypothetical protein
VQKYDITLKMLLRGTASRTLQMLAGDSIADWLDIELPQMELPRMDLLGRLSGGRLAHFELQSGNDDRMPERMAGYALGVFRQFREFPKQIVLYIGREKVRMKPRLMAEDFRFRYTVLDIRKLDGYGMLASRNTGDALLAVLADLRDRRAAVAEVVRRIAGLEPTDRHEALQQLLILAGLRGLDDTVEEEIDMAVIEIGENTVLGREFRRREVQGELRVIRRLIERRFGSIPPWAEEALGNKSAAELETIGDRLLDAQSIQDLLR